MAGRWLGLALSTESGLLSAAWHLVCSSLTSGCAAGLGYPLFTFDGHSLLQRMDSIIENVLLVCPLPFVSSKIKVCLSHLSFPSANNEGPGFVSPKPLVPPTLCVPSHWLVLRAAGGREVGTSLNFPVSSGPFGSGQWSWEGSLCFLELQTTL